MPNTIQIKRNTTANVTPTAGQLASGELAINTADGRLFAKNAAGTVVNLPVTSISGQAITPSKLTTTAANSATTGEAQIYLNGSTGNRIDFNSNGSAIPNLLARTAGTKICLYPAFDGNGSTDYAIGISSNALWQSVPDQYSEYEFAWYGGESKVAYLTGSGNFSAASVTAGSIFTPGLWSKASVYDVTEIGSYTFYNNNDVGNGEIGAIGKILCSTSNTPTAGFLVFSAATPEAVNGYNAVLRETFGVHPGGVVVDPTTTFTRDNPAVALDVRGSAAITGALSVNGGIQSPQTGLFLWQNFR